MIRKLTLVAGFGAGYVLGAKAGTQRYDQIMGMFRDLAGMPAVQDVTHTLADMVTGHNEVVDLSKPSPKSRTGARTSTAPMPEV